MQIVISTMIVSIHAGCGKAHGMMLTVVFRGEAHGMLTVVFRGKAHGMLTVLFRGKAHGMLTV